jgi:hypothetical protein
MDRRARYTSDIEDEDAMRRSRTACRSRRAEQPIAIGFAPENWRMNKPGSSEPRGERRERQRRCREGVKLSRGTRLQARRRRSPRAEREHTPSCVARLPSLPRVLIRRRPRSEAVVDALDTPHVASRARLDSPSGGRDANARRFCNALSPRPRCCRNGYFVYDLSAPLVYCTLVLCTSVHIGSPVAGQCRAGAIDFSPRSAKAIFSTAVAQEKGVSGRTGVYDVEVHDQRGEPRTRHDHDPPRRKKGRGARRRPGLLQCQ